MSRVVWLNGALVDPSDATLSIDDPGFRYGEGLYETMRATDGAIPWLDRHMARLARSLDALGLDDAPRVDAVQAAVETVLAALPAGVFRVRATVTPMPTLLVEAVPAQIDPERTVTAISLRDWWFPDRRIAEHKTLSFLGWRDAAHRAQSVGADIALLLDHDGRIGEASSANAFCVVRGELVTAPIRGILPGVTRSVVMDRFDTREAVLTEPEWRAADEMFVTSGVNWVVPVVACDGRPVGNGEVGPMTRRVATDLSGSSPS